MSRLPVRIQHGGIGGILQKLCTASVGGALAVIQIPLEEAHVVEVGAPIAVGEAQHVTFLHALRQELDSMQMLFHDRDDILGGAAEDIIAVMEKHLHAVKLLTERMEESDVLRLAYGDGRAYLHDVSLLQWNLNYRKGATNGRRAELLQDPAYASVLDAYR